MPWSVRVAIAAFLFAALVQSTTAMLFAASSRGAWANALLAALLFALLVWGLFTGRRIAWAWARGVGFVLSALVVAAVVVEWVRIGRAHPVHLLPLLGIALPLLLAAAALGRPSAYGWFRLVCPTCGARTGRFADFRFRKARCHGCGNVF